MPALHSSLTALLTAVTGALVLDGAAFAVTHMPNWTMEFLASNSARTVRPTYDPPILNLLERRKLPCSDSFKCLGVGKIFTSQDVSLALKQTKIALNALDPTRNYGTSKGFICCTHYNGSHCYIRKTCLLFSQHRCFSQTLHSYIQNLYLRPSNLEISSTEQVLLNITLGAISEASRKGTFLSGLSIFVCIPEQSGSPNLQFAWLCAYKGTHLKLHPVQLVHQYLPSGKFTRAGNSNWSSSSLQQQGSYALLRILSQEGMLVPRAKESGTTLPYRYH